VAVDHDHPAGYRFVKVEDLQPDDIIMVHVNFLGVDAMGKDMFSALREEYMKRTARGDIPGRPGEYLFETTDVVRPDGTPEGEALIIPAELKHLIECTRNHAPGCCKCHMPLLDFGQDESCYCAYAVSKKEWRLLCQVRLYARFHVLYPLLLSRIRSSDAVISPSDGRGSASRIIRFENFNSSILFTSLGETNAKKPMLGAQTSYT
jgi:hypothetical protein